MAHQVPSFTARTEKDSVASDQAPRSAGSVQDAMPVKADDCPDLFAATHHALIIYIYLPFSGHFFLSLGDAEWEAQKPNNFALLSRSLKI